MVVRHYFKVLRNPAKGGLHISETSENFPRDCLEEIENHCLEIISADFQKNACAIYPVSEDCFIVMLAKKTNGTLLENRQHDIIHGIVVNGEEFRQVYRNNLSQDWLDQAFFPNITRGELELVETGFARCFDVKDPLGDFKKDMDGNQFAGFYNMLMEVIQKRRKVQLIVPEGMERVVQAACYDLLPVEERGRIFIISNGECTMAEADILITREIQYQDFRKYKQMTLDEFIAYGLRLKRDAVPVERKEAKPKEMTADEAVEACVNYIFEDDVAESTISLIRNKVMTPTREGCEEFQLKLRCELEELYVRRSEFEKFVQVMALAFENYGGECVDRKQVMLIAPYDMQGLARFIHKVSNSEKERERYWKGFMEQLLEQYAIFGDRTDLKKKWRF